MNQIATMRGYDEAKARKGAGGEEAQKMQERLSGFIQGLEAEAKRRVQLRLSIEERWLADLRQYHGMYDERDRDGITDKDGSMVFINQTRPKTNMLAARLMDLLFPTDDRNWGISPSPVPEIADDLSKTQDTMRDADDTFADRERQLRQTEQAQAANPQAAPALEEKAAALAEEMDGLDKVRQEIRTKLQDLADVQAIAQDRCDLMEREIEDQLMACQYQHECRRMIMDACKIGVGVLKGPVTGTAQRQIWRLVEGDEGPGSFKLTDMVDETTPGAHWVDPWAFYPDPDAATISDCEGFFERHLMNKKKLRRFARDPEVDKDVVRELLTAGPDSNANPSYYIRLTNITGQRTESAKDMYSVWEYTGPIETEDMQALIANMADEKTRQTMEEAGAEIDPLQELHARVWFCQGKVLKFALHPLDSNEPIYSVYNIEKDEGSLFGFGVPYVMRDPQAMMNGAYRMMMDNAALSTGPQIVVNKEAVTPEDGNWNITPRKVWQRNNSDIGSQLPPFEAHNIPSNLTELAAIIDISMKAIDEVTGLPQIAQGEQGSGVTKTAQGMALLMNSANVIFKRVVKMFDDQVTTPMIRRFYHWNMQFNEREEVKGDYEVDARGSSVLLVREMLSQNLMMIANGFVGHPVFGDWIKEEDLLRLLIKSHTIPADEVIRTQDEYDEHMKSKGEQGDPLAQLKAQEMELKAKELEARSREIEANIEIANMEADTRLKVAQLTFDAKMEQATAQANAKEAEGERRAATERAKVDSGERRLAAEVAMRERTGKSSGGAV